MKMKTFLFGILTALVVLGVNAQGTWTQKADFAGAARFYAVGFSIGSKGYIGTGYTEIYYNYGYVRDFWEYDPATNVWTQKANFGGAVRCYASGFSINGKGYIGMGEYWNGAGNTYFKDFWEYDPQVNIWTKKADFGGAARSQAAGFSLGNKGYIGTGAGTGYYKDFWEYDPAMDKWTQKADFAGSARTTAVGFGINDKGYIGVGWDGSLKNDFWEYDPAADNWMQQMSFGGAPRLDAAGFSMNGKGYIGTGSGTGDYSDFWEYQPSSDMWLRKADFAGTTRWGGAVGFSVINKGYIGTGGGSIYFKDFWEYTPDEQSTGIPTITLFSPASGPVGTTVNITGTNFGPNPIDNIVYFGATQATVIAASASSLTVTVPPGATYLPITVITNNLTAYSAAPFIVTFENGGGGFTANSFAPFEEFPTNSTGSFGVAPGDLDGDGKADIIVNNLLSGNLSVSGNTSVSGSISFSAATVYSVIGNGQYPANSMADLDGDGKLDFAVANQQVSSISVFRNISTSGNIKLSSKIDFSTGTAPADLAFGDIDGDGKTDMVTADIDVNKFSVLLNTGSPGNISFANKVDFSTSANPRSLAIRDVDGDRKSDIVIINIFGTNTLSVFRNTSTVGAISFAAKVDFPSFGNDAYIFAGDLDGDTKPDIVAADLNSSAISVFRNTSTTGNISFDPYINYTTAPGPYFVSIGDLDGDGKPDVAVAHNTGTIMSVLKNNSTTGTISLGAPVTYKVSSTSVVPQSLTICDLDNDGKPDIAVTGVNAGTFSVLRNQINSVICPAPTGLNVVNISDTCARLQWTSPSSEVCGFEIRYRPTGATEWKVRWKKTNGNSLRLYGLLPNTTYRWQIRSLCKDRNTSAWVTGPNFTTDASFAISANSANNIFSKIPGSSAVQVMPNPSKGNFTLIMQLPAKDAFTTLVLYNNLGNKVWQQQAGILSGAVTTNIALDNKLSAGVYILKIERSDVRLMQKIIITK